MASEQLTNYFNNLKNLISANGISGEYVDILVKVAQVAIQSENDVEFGLQVTGYAKKCCEDMVAKKGYTLWDLEKYCFANKTRYEIIDKWYSILLIEAQNKVLDSYMLYLEKNREPKDRFYAPKRKQFLKIGLTQAFQEMLDDKLDLLTISLPPGSGKTTFEKFFHSGLCGWFPDDGNLFFSHSAGITRMYYDGVLAIMTNAEDYAWKDIFPTCEITNTNAKAEQININSYKPFPNVQTASVGSEMAGKVRVSENGYLLCDDMIGKIEEALNKNTLEKLWNAYSTDARQRKKDGAKEIHIATRWSVSDIIGRLMVAFQGNKRAKFISVPDIDPVTGESNFDFEINGFSVEFYKDQEKLMDDISYRCLYKNDPIEREGLLYNDDELRRYTELPNREPDAIIGVCDTKTTGIDYMVLPVFYQYDNDYYLVDCICNNTTDFGLQISNISNLIVNHKMQQCEFESNAGGSRLAYDVDKVVKEKGGFCNITSKATESNKETRIITNSDWIKRNCLFKYKEDYAPKSDYGIFMDFVLSYSVVGKNKFDDVVDCLSLFKLFVERKYRVRTASIMTSPF